MRDNEACCPHCNRIGLRADMEYYHMEEIPERLGPEYAFDLVDDFFCKGIYTGKWTVDPCDEDAYESCFELYCGRRGIEL